MFSNPKGKRKRSADEITERVLEITYRHNEDGEWYRHRFLAGVSARMIEGGKAVVLYRKDGKPIMQDFR